MPKIFSAPANVQGGIRVKQATADMFGGGSGLIEAGRAITEFGEERARQDAIAARKKEIADDKLLRSQVAAEKSTAAVNIAEAREQWTNQINASATSGEPTAGLRERSMAEFKTYADSVVAGFNTPEGKAAARVGLARLGATLSISASTHEAAAQARQIRDDFTAGNIATANVLMRNPEMLDGEGAELGDLGLMKERVDAANDLPVAAELKRTIAGETRRMLTEAAIRGHIRKEPEKTLADLSNGVYDATLHTNTVLSLMTDANVKIAGEEKKESHRVSMEVADLLVRVSRGEATQADVDQYIAANKPYMSPSQVTSLNYKVDTTERRVARGILDPNKGWDAAQISVKITEATDLETLAGLGASVAELRGTFKPAAWARLRKDLHAKKMKILGADQKTVDAKAKLAEGWGVAHLRNAAKRAQTKEEVLALEQALGAREDIKPRDWESIQNILDKRTFKFIEAERKASAKEGKRLNDVAIVRLTQTINNAHLDDIPALRAYVEVLVNDQGLEAKPYKTLVAALDSRAVEARTQRDQTQLVGAALAGQTSLDPNTAGHRKAVDVAFEAMQQQWAEEELTPETVAANTVAFSVKVGIIPASVKTAVQGGLNSPNPEVVAYSAQLVDKMHRQKPSLVSQFSGDEVALARQISRTIEAGATPQEAMEHIRALRKVSESDRTARGKEFDTLAEKSITGHSLVQTMVAEMINDDAFGASDFFSSDPTPSRALESEATRLMREEYQKVGDMDLAKQAVTARLPRAWAATAIDSSPRVMRDAPELHYSQPSLSHSENSEWMREQLVSDISANALSSPGIEDRIKLVVDRTRTRGGGLPVYNIFVLPVDGNPGFFMTTGDDHIRWAPDYDTSVHKQRAAAAQEAREAAFARARAVAAIPVDEESP